VPTPASAAAWADSGFEIVETTTHQPRADDEEDDHR
jgi:hypothetical protein